MYCHVLKVLSYAIKVRVVMTLNLIPQGHIVFSYPQEWGSDLKYVHSLNIPIQYALGQQKKCTALVLFTVEKEPTICLVL